MEASGDHHAIAPVTLCNQIHDYDDDDDDDNDDDDDDIRKFSHVGTKYLQVCVLAKA